MSAFAKSGVIKLSRNWSERRVGTSCWRPESQTRVSVRDKIVFVFISSWVGLFNVEEVSYTVVLIKFVLSKSRTKYHRNISAYINQFNSENNRSRCGLGNINLSRSRLIVLQIFVDS